MQKITAKKLLSAADLSDALGIPRRTLELLVARGEVPRPLRIGRHRKWRPVDVDAWIEERAEAATNKATQAERTKEGT